jgi:prephenate dehydrogenase
MKHDCACIAGAGLVGGSLAKALKLKCGIRRIIGIDTDAGNLKRGIDSGILDEGYSKPGGFLEECGVVFVCAPVPVCAQLAIDISKFTKPECIITDTASSKTGIMEAVDKAGGGIRFIGGHPMAGSERSGFEYSREDMFENAFYIIIENEDDPDGVLEVKGLAEMMGAIPVVTSAREHDLAVATVSHVPHITAAALVNLLDASRTEKLSKNIAAGGFRDITRIASSQPELWRDIILSNRQAVSEELGRLIGILKSFRMYIRDSQNDSIYGFFDNAKLTRDVISGEREGLLPGKYQVVVQVPDKPGVIAGIATVLGEHGLNIKNINVTHSREDFGGVLVVELYDSQGKDGALKVLESEGYTVSAID